MRLPAVLAALALPAAALAQTAPEGLVQHYACAGGAHLAAAYINPPEGGSYAVVVFDGTMTPMKAGLTAPASATSRSASRGSSGTPRARRLPRHDDAD